MRLRGWAGLGALAISWCVAGATNVRAQDCTLIELQYYEALQEARVCNPVTGNASCTMLVQNGLGGCPCPTFINPANTLAQARMDSLRREWIAHGCRGGECGAAACEEIPYAV